MILPKQRIITVSFRYPAITICSYNPFTKYHPEVDEIIKDKMIVDCIKSCQNFEETSEECFLCYHQLTNKQRFKVLETSIKILFMQFNISYN